MSYAENPYQSFGLPVAQAGVDVRAAFIRKTYIHLGAAIAGFVALQALIFKSGVADTIMETFLATRYSWLIVLGGFMIVSWIAESWANSATSIGKQYAGLTLYVVGEAIIFVPLLYIAHAMEDARGVQIIMPAAAITLFLFSGLTAIVMITAKDFSFLRTGLMLGGLVAFGLIVCSVLFGFNLGIIFVWAMVVLACGYILYHTSAVMKHYQTTQYVAASLALFASVALLFWYILQLVMRYSSND